MAGCDQCEVVSLNGVACHETGCPNTWIDPATGEAHWRACRWCGSQFVPEERGQRFCDDSCWRSFQGLEDLESILAGDPA